MNKTNIYLKTISEVLAAAHAQDFQGYSKFDALNSPVLEKLSFKNKWLRLLITQLVKECPIHIRQLLGVKKSRNPKGIALFARAYLFLYQKTNKQLYLNEAKKLLEWLLQNPSPGTKNICWGYNFIWQNTIFLQDRFEPNVIVTIFIGEALIHCYRVTKEKKYLESATSVTRFLLDEVPVLHDDKNEKAIAYVLRKVDAAVLNNNVLAGAFLIKVWKETGNNTLLDNATRLLNFTVKRRTEYNAWYYTHPKGKSHIRHDNYHTGGIVDGLLDYYEETGDDRFNAVYWKGLEYYKKHLFEEDGAPRWMNDSKFPYDIHGSAQGIISFAKAARHDKKYQEQVEKIAEWTLKHLYRQETQDFIYREGRFMKWNYSLMRWCNAWMSRALGEMIK